MPDGALPVEQQLEQMRLFLRRCQGDLPYMARRMLKIKPKVATAGLQPLTLNRAQQYAHDMVEKQKAETGKVRALILKARQQGMSTYIQGRFFWLTNFYRLNKAFILTHQDDATQNLFLMAKRFHDNMPADFKQPTEAANANTLRFAVSGGEYGVATAGSKETGRSQTAQLFHGSECAFWPHADVHAKGIGQIVANEPGTEIILESTANGIGGDFHERWQRAEAGDGEYIAIFSPWFWSEEYRLEVPDGYEFTDEALEQQELYDLDDMQLYWRAMKIADEFKGDLNAFRQEYPANSVEAFTSNTDSLIPGAHIDRARKDKLATPSNLLVIGVDPKREGNDRFGMAWRRGRVVEKVEGSSAAIDTMEAAGMLARIIDRDRPAKMFIDVVGLGAGVYDRLVELGYGTIVVPVKAGAAADQPELYVNKRAEMRDRNREWFADYPNRIPDQDDIARDLLAPRHTRDSNQKLKIETKEQMKKRGIRSPDLGDAIDLTHAFPVSPLLGDDSRGDPYAGGVPWQAR